MDQTTTFTTVVWILLGSRFYICVSRQSSHSIKNWRDTRRL